MADQQFRIHSADGATQRSRSAFCRGDCWRRTFRQERIRDNFEPLFQPSQESFLEEKGLGSYFHIKRYDKRSRQFQIDTMKFLNNRNYLCILTVQLTPGQALDSIKISKCIHFGSIISYLGKSEAHHQYKPRLWGATLLATEIELTGQLKRETYENSICL